MRHHDNIRKFGLETGQRSALLKSLALALIMHKKITTTEAKAKSVTNNLPLLSVLGAVTI